MNDTKLTELARAESPADPALRERVWARLQSADAAVSAPSPRRWPRFAVVGALALASGVGVIALRPGTTPLAPAVAFAEVDARDGADSDRHLGREIVRMRRTPISITCDRVRLRFPFKITTTCSDPDRR